jgi:hypothetical protein
MRWWAVAETDPKVPWYKSPWVRWAAAVVLPSTLAVLCPMLPWPAAQLACKAAGHVVVEVAKRSGDASPSAPVDSSTVTRGECIENTVRSVPDFCRCRNGQWTDYYDAGVCGS